MTAIARRDTTIRGVQVMQLPNSRATLAGPLDRVSALLDMVRDAGQLVDTTDPQPTGEPGMVMVTARLVPAVPARQLRQRPSRFSGRALAVAAVVGVAVAGSLALAIAAALSWIAAHIGLVIAFALVVSLISGGITRHYCTTTVKVTHRH